MKQVGDNTGKQHAHTIPYDGMLLTIHQKVKSPKNPNILKKGEYHHAHKKSIQPKYIIECKTLCNELDFENS